MGAIAAGGKTITFTKSGAVVKDKKTGLKSTYKKSNKGSYVRTSKEVFAEQKASFEKPEVINKIIQKAETTQEVKTLRSNLAKTLSKPVADRIKLEKLAQLNRLYSSQRQENQRKEIENLINASVPRQLSTQNQIDTLNRVIDKKARELAKKEQNTITPPPQKQQIKGIFNTLRSKTGGTQARATLESFAIKAQANNQYAKAALQRLLQLPGAFLDSALEIFAGLETIATQNPVITLGALASIKKSDIDNAGANFGVRLARGEPKAFSEAYILLAPVPLPRVSKYVKTVKTNLSLPSTKRLNFIKSEIKRLESIKVKTGKELKDLDRYRQLLKEDKLVSKLDKILIKAQTQEKNFVKSKTKSSAKTAENKIKQLDKEVKKIVKQIKILDNKKAVQSLFKKTKTQTANQKLNELLKSKVILQTTKKDINVTQLVSLLLKARKISGEAFKKVKTKIQKVTGLKVVQRTKKGKVTYVLLDPKTRKPFKKKPKETIRVSDSKGRTPKTKRPTVLVKAEKIKQFKQEKALMKKAIKEIKEQTDISKPFTIDKKITSTKPRKRKKKGIRQEILGERLRDLFKDKKARASLIPQTKIVFNKRNKNFGSVYRSISNEYKDIVKGVQQGKRELQQARNIKLRERANKKIKSNINKKDKLKAQIKRNIKVLERDRALIRDLIKANIRLNTVLSKIQSQLKIFQKLEAKFNVLKTPKIKKLKPIKPISIKAIKVSTRKVQTRKPKKPPIKPKPPVKPPVKPRIPPKPPKIPIKKIPIPRLSLSSKLPRGQNLKFNAVYRAKGKNVLLKLNLPINKAYRRVGQLIDRTTSRSMQLVVSGTTKQKDIKKPSITKKFRIRKGKDNKVLILVEKSKHTIDTRGEKKGLSVAKALKKSIKRVKKSSRKRSKSVKRSKR